MWAALAVLLALPTAAVAVWNTDTVQRATSSCTDAQLAALDEVADAAHRDLPGRTGDLGLDYCSKSLPGVATATSADRAELRDALRARWGCSQPSRSIAPVPWTCHAVAHEVWVSVDQGWVSVEVVDGP